MLNFRVIKFNEYYIGCGFGGIAVSCSGDLCRSSICEAHDNSVCEIDSCSNCTVEHYVGLKKVTEQCGKSCFAVLF